MKRASREDRDASSSKHARYDLKDESDYESSGDEDEDMDDEDAEYLRQRAYEEHLPRVRSLLGNDRPNLLKDDLQRPCSVCNSCKYYKGWRALMAHARTFKQKKPQQHRGLLRALEEVITPNSVGNTKVELGDTRVSSSYIAMQETRRIVWPPVLLLEGVHDVVVAQGVVSEVLKADVVEEIIVTDEKKVLVRLKDLPVSLTAVHKLEETPRNRSFVVLKPEDMPRVDPEKKAEWHSTTQDEVIKWLKAMNRENEAASNWLRAEKLKQVLMDEQNQEIRVVGIQLARSLQEMKTKCNEVHQTSKLMEQQRLRMIQDQNKRYEYQMKKLQAELDQEELRVKTALQSNTEKTVKDKMKMLKHNDLLQRMLAEGSERAQKLSHECLQLKDSKKSLNNKLRVDSSGLEDQFRMDEMSMIANHEREMKQLEDEFEQSRQDAISGLLKPKPPPVEEAKQECAVCWRVFGEDVNMRARLECNHAALCDECGEEMYKAKKACPICRAPIVKKPVAMFHKIFM